MSLKKLKKLDPKIRQKCLELAAASDDPKLQKWHDNVFNSKGLVPEIKRIEAKNLLDQDNYSNLDKADPMNKNDLKSNYDAISVSEDDCDDCENRSVQSTSSIPDKLLEDEHNDEKFVMWIKTDGAQLSRFEIEKSENFGGIFDQFCRKIGATIDSVCFFHGVNIVGCRDTPISLSVPNFSIIEAKVVHSSSTEIIVENDADSIRLKFQTQDLRNSTNVLKVKKNDKFSAIKAKYLDLRSREETKLDDIGFLFDGSVISNDSTPEMLELEELDCIDVIRQ